MSVEPWSPPPVEKPSPWQRERVAIHLSGFLPELASRLNALAGGHVAIDQLSIEPLDPASAPAAVTSPDLVAALVAASLGHALVPSLDLASPAESAVLSLVHDAVGAWAGAVLPHASAAPDAAITVAVRCLSAHGRLSISAAWSDLWALVGPALAEGRRPIHLPTASAVVTIEALLPASDLTAADVLNFRSGDLVLTSCGPNGHVILQAGEIRLATAGLGALGGHLAARIDQLSGRDHRDGSG
jgi:Type III flagellar switch regulator (C-ring) FliN C-term